MEMPNLIQSSFGPFLGWTFCISIQGSLIGEGQIFVIRLRIAVVVEVVEHDQRPQVVDIEEGDENHTEDEGDTASPGENYEKGYSHSEEDNIDDQLEEDVRVDESVVVLSDTVNLATGKDQKDEENPFPQELNPGIF